MCGELPTRRTRNDRPSGSSPRVRGTHQPGLAPVGEIRFIPACAGNSQGGDGDHARVAVHPRVCGELVSVRAGVSSGSGSSPRVRGTRPIQPAPKGGCRFIPACAGNSVRPPAGSSLSPVHPRVCGELRIPFFGGRRVRGSSPRVRGTRARGAADARRSAVHPRVCGELARSATFAVRGTGSSPRVRGTRRRPAIPGRFRRFIPACAGNSVHLPRGGEVKTVHPRVCGELGRTQPALQLRHGSSPRVRGTRWRPIARLPAAPVHPRVCGELVDLFCGAGGWSRFIPACAGNSPCGCRRT